MSSLQSSGEEEEKEEEEGEGGGGGGGGRGGRVIDSHGAPWWEKSLPTELWNLSDQQVQFSWDQGGARRWDFEF